MAGDAAFLMPVVLNSICKETVAAALALALAAVLGCDSVPGSDSAEGVPPVVSNFTFSPAVIDISALPPDQRTDSTVAVPFSIELSAGDSDGQVTRVQFVLQGLQIGSPPVLEGVLRPAGSVFRIDTTLTLAIGALGTYSLLAFALDDQGLISNRVRGILRLGSSVPIGGPPVIEDVEADPPVIRPPTSFRLIATVSDPDGLENIQRVLGTAPNGSEFEMLDDGVSFGDDTANDGRFTARFDVPSAEPGTQVFRIQAFDRSGLSSEVFEKEVTVE